MNKYENLYVITPELEEEAIKAIIEKFSGIITANGGEIESVDEWGKRRLAYPCSPRFRLRLSSPVSWSATSTTMRTSFVTSSFARKRNGTPFFSAERSVSQ